MYYGQAPSMYEITKLLHCVKTKKQIKYYGQAPSMYEITKLFFELKNLI